MVLSSRDRRCVVVEMVWLGPSPERRRLRFSFQFNDVKDRDRLSPAPLFSAGGRRRRLSRGPPFPCQSPVSILCEKVPKAGPRGTRQPHPTPEGAAGPIREPIEGALTSPLPPSWQGDSGGFRRAPPRQGRRRGAAEEAPQRNPRGGLPRRSVRPLGQGLRPPAPPPGC